MVAGLFDRAEAAVNERHRIAATEATATIERAWARWIKEAQNHLVYGFGGTRLADSAWRRGGGAPSPLGTHYLEADVEGRTVRYYPQRGEMVLAVVTPCCGRWWESGALRNVAALGLAELARKRVMKDGCGREACHEDGAA